MATTYKVLGQLNPSANGFATLYTAPTSAVTSTLVVCNQGAAGSFRVAVCPAGASINAKHYISYDVPISANDSIFLTLGISLSATDVILVYASSANFSFSLFGAEL
jgi:hypothetical protein